MAVLAVSPLQVEALGKLDWPGVGENRVGENRRPRLWLR